LTCGLAQKLGCDYGHYDFLVDFVIRMSDLMLERGQGVS
jgi:hypothetical protein